MDAPWGLARISQHGPVGSGPWKYSYNGDGSGVTVYVLDSGLDVAHRDFEGRAFWLGNVTGDGIERDCHGRGTHLAGTVGGKTYGVAKKAALRAVKVAGCDGAVTAETLIKGMALAVGDKKGIRGNVILIGAALPRSSAVDNAVQSAFDKGFVVVATAGGPGDACESSPGSAPNALTVGATTKNDRILPVTGRGLCVDVMGPAEDTLSTWTGGEDETRTESEPASAAAHAAGIAAYYLSQQAVTNAQVTERILSTSTKNAVRDIPNHTPNLLLYNNIA